MISLGIGKELASSTIKPKIPRYPQDEIVWVTFFVKCITVLMRGPFVQDEFIMVSTKISNAT